MRPGWRIRARPFPHSLTRAMWCHGVPSAGREVDSHHSGLAYPLPSIQYLIWMRRTGGTSTSPGPEANGDSCSAAPLLPRLALGPLWPRPIVADSAILPSVILSRAPRPISACWTDRTTFIAGAGQADRVAASQPPAIYQVPYNYFDT